MMDSGREMLTFSIGALTGIPPLVNSPLAR
jgi:hypothetical protein